MAGNDNNLMPRGPIGTFKAMMWSLKGIRAAIIHEASFRLEVLLFLIMAPLGIWLGETAIEQVLLVGCLLLVLSAELLNSAVEACVDRFGPEMHELAGRAKDMGSAAVLLLLLNVALTWGLILIPRWVAN